MKNKILIFSFFILFLFLFSTVSVKAEDFEPYGNKIYYSIDKNVVLIAPNNNRTLGLYFSYEYYLVDNTNSNLSVYLNDTLIYLKETFERAFISHFYVNQTEFILTVRNNHNDTIILVRYICEGGFIPIHEGNYPDVTKWKKQFIPPTPEKLLMNDVFKIALFGLIYTILMSYLVGLIVKWYKEHRTVESEFMARRTYYTTTRDKYE